MASYWKYSLRFNYHLCLENTGNEKKRRFCGRSQERLTERTDVEHSFRAALCILHHTLHLKGHVPARCHNCQTDALCTAETMQRDMKA